MDPSHLKTPPAYAVTSVDHALRLAAVLQLEGRLTVAAAAERLGVARSTAHRLLQMLVYRDFATQDDDRVYHPGPVVELAVRSRSDTALLRSVSMPYLRRLSNTLNESVNVSIRTGDTTRFIASVECERRIRVTSREGMVFPLTQTTTGMLYLADLTDDDLRQYLTTSHRDGQSSALTKNTILKDVGRVRRLGFALNTERSERGLVAVGVPVHTERGQLLAGLSVSMPSVRYEEPRLDSIVSVLQQVGTALEAELTG